MFKTLQKLCPDAYQVDIFDENNPKLLLCQTELRWVIVQFMTALNSANFLEVDYGQEELSSFPFPTSRSATSSTIRKHQEFGATLIKNEFYLRYPFAVCLLQGNTALRTAVFECLGSLFKTERGYYPNNILSMQSFMSLFRVATVHI